MQPTILSQGLLNLKDFKTVFHQMEQFRERLLWRARAGRKANHRIDYKETAITYFQLGETILKLIPALLQFSNLSVVTHWTNRRQSDQQAFPIERHPHPKILTYKLGCNQPTMHNVCEIHRAHGGIYVILVVASLGCSRRSPAPIDFSCAGSTMV